MTEWYGWAGTILRVDLSTGKIVKQRLSEDLAYNFVGGRGINSKILYDETDPQTDPLSPANRLIVGTGPVTGTLGPSAGRFTVTAKSPLTGILGDGNGGGEFAAELKFAGYDHIVFQGRAPEPVYLWIDDEQVQIRKARHLWGKNTWETEEILRKELGDNEIKTLCIGPGGENLVKFACLITSDDRAPARTGTGAVAGSKNLKAIAVRGSRSVKLANPSRYREVIGQLYKALHEQPLFPWFSDIGTAHLPQAANKAGTISIKNLQENQWPDEVVGELYGENFLRRHEAKNWSCFACPTHCNHFITIKDGPYTGLKGKRPEGVNSFGAPLGVTSFPFTLNAWNLSNQYGLDVKSTAEGIGAAMEWFQRGIITGEDTDGLELEWGNHEVILKLIDKIAMREGFGDILAEGPVKAAQKIGKGAEFYVPHVKGLTQNLIRVDRSPISLLGHCVNTRGMDHLRGTVATAHLADMKEDMLYGSVAVDWVIHYQDVCTGADLAEICKFNTEWMIFTKGGGVEMMAEILSAITGVDFSEEHLRLAAERVFNIEKAYLVREGLRRKDDNPPRRYVEEPFASGPYKGQKTDLEKYGKLLDVYYEKRGWDKATGAPTRDKLEQLGLNYVADDLDKVGVYREQISL